MLRGNCVGNLRDLAGPTVRDLERIGACGDDNGYVRVDMWDAEHEPSLSARLITDTSIDDRFPDTFANKIFDPGEASGELAEKKANFKEAKLLPRPPRRLRGILLACVANVAGIILGASVGFVAMRWLSHLTKDKCTDTVHVKDLSMLLNMSNMTSTSQMAIDSNMSNLEDFSMHDVTFYSKATTYAYCHYIRGKFYATLLIMILSAIMFGYLLLKLCFGRIYTQTWKEEHRIKELQLLYSMRSEGSRLVLLFWRSRAYTVFFFDIVVLFACRYYLDMYLDVSAMLIFLEHDDVYFFLLNLGGVLLGLAFTTVEMCKMLRTQASVLSPSLVLLLGISIPVMGTHVLFLSILSLILNERHPFLFISTLSEAILESSVSCFVQTYAVVITIGLSWAKRAKLYLSIGTSFVSIGQAFASLDTYDGGIEILGLPGVCKIYNLQYAAVLVFRIAEVSSMVTLVAIAFSVFRDYAVRMVASCCYGGILFLVALVNQYQISRALSEDHEVRRQFAMQHLLYVLPCIICLMSPLLEMDCTFTIPFNWYVILRFLLSSAALGACGYKLNFDIVQFNALFEDDETILRVCAFSHITLLVMWLVIRILRKRVLLDADQEIWTRGPFNETQQVLRNRILQTEAGASTEETSLWQEVSNHIEARFANERTRSLALKLPNSKLRARLADRLSAAHTNYNFKDILRKPSFEWDVCYLRSKLSCFMTNALRDLRDALEAYKRYDKARPANVLIGSVVSIKVPKGMGLLTAGARVDWLYDFGAAEFEQTQQRFVIEALDGSDLEGSTVLSGETPVRIRSLFHGCCLALSSDKMGYRFLTLDKNRSQEDKRCAPGTVFKLTCVLEASYRIKEFSDMVELIELPIGDDRDELDVVKLTFPGKGPEPLDWDGTGWRVYTIDGQRATREKLRTVFPTSTYTSDTILNAEEIAMSVNQNDGNLLQDEGIPEEEEQAVEDEEEIGNDMEPMKSSTALWKEQQAQVDVDAYEDSKKAKKVGKRKVSVVFVKTKSEKQNNCVPFGSKVLIHAVDFNEVQDSARSLLEDALTIADELGGKKGSCSVCELRSYAEQHGKPETDDDRRNLEKLLEWLSEPGHFERTELDDDNRICLSELRRAVPRYLAEQRSGFPLNFEDVLEVPLEYQFEDYSTIDFEKIGRELKRHTKAALLDFRMHGSVKLRAPFVGASSARHASTHQQRDDLAETIALINNETIGRVYSFVEPDLCIVFEKMEFADMEHTKFKNALEKDFNAYGLSIDLKAGALKVVIELVGHLAGLHALGYINPSELISATDLKLDQVHGEPKRLQAAKRTFGDQSLDGTSMVGSEKIRTLKKNAQARYVSSSMAGFVQTGGAQAQVGSIFEIKQTDLRAKDDTWLYRWAADVVSKNRVAQTTKDSLAEKFRNVLTLAFNARANLERTKGIFHCDPNLHKDLLTILHNCVGGSPVCEQTTGSVYEETYITKLYEKQGGDVVADKKRGLFSRRQESYQSVDGETALNFVLNNVLFKKEGIEQVFKPVKVVDSFIVFVVDFHQASEQTSSKALTESDQQELERLFKSYLKMADSPLTPSDLESIVFTFKPSADGYNLRLNGLITTMQKLRDSILNKHINLGVPQIKWHGSVEEEQIGQIRQDDTLIQVISQTDTFQFYLRPSSGQGKTLRELHKLSDHGIASEKYMEAHASFFGDLKRELSIQSTPDFILEGGSDEFKVIVCGSSQCLDEMRELMGRDHMTNDKTFRVLEESYGIRILGDRVEHRHFNHPVAIRNAFGLVKDVVLPTWPRVKWAQKLTLVFQSQVAQQVESAVLKMAVSNAKQLAAIMPSWGEIAPQDINIAKAWGITRVNDLFQTKCSLTYKILEYGWEQSNLSFKHDALALHKAFDAAVAQQANSEQVDNASGVSANNAAEEKDSTKTGIPFLKWEALCPSEDGLNQKMKQPVALSRLLRGMPQPIACDIFLLQLDVLTMAWEKTPRAVKEDKPALRELFRPYVELQAMSDGVKVLSERWKNPTGASKKTTRNECVAVEMPDSLKKFLRRMTPDEGGDANPDSKSVVFLSRAWSPEESSEEEYLQVRRVIEKFDQVRNDAQSYWSDRIKELKQASNKCRTRLEQVLSEMPEKLHVVLPSEWQSGKQGTCRSLLSKIDPSTLKLTEDFTYEDMETSDFNVELQKGARLSFNAPSMCVEGDDQNVLRFLFKKLDVRGIGSQPMKNAQRMQLINTKFEEEIKSALLGLDLSESDFETALKLDYNIESKRPYSAKVDISGNASTMRGLRTRTSKKPITVMGTVGKRSRLTELCSRSLLSIILETSSANEARMEALKIAKALLDSMSVHIEQSQEQHHDSELYLSSAEILQGRKDLHELAERLKPDLYKLVERLDELVEGTVVSTDQPKKLFEMDSSNLAKELSFITDQFFSALGQAMEKKTLRSFIEARQAFIHLGGKVQKVQCQLIYIELFKLGQDCVLEFGHSNVLPFDDSSAQRERFNDLDAVAREIEAFRPAARNACELFPELQATLDQLLLTRTEIMNFSSEQKNKQINRKLVETRKERDAQRLKAEETYRHEQELDEENARLRAEIAQLREENVQLREGVEHQAGALEQQFAAEREQLQGQLKTFKSKLAFSEHNLKELRKELRK